MKKAVVLVLLWIPCLSISAQQVQIDGRLQPLLDDFFEVCKEYNIDYHEKLFNLERIDIVNTLQVSESGSTLGMLRRNENGEVIAIDISWLAQIDPEILKVVAFHEFAHYFLDYSKHTCHDCGEIMAVVNSSYFDIVRDWDEQVKNLFENSPLLKEKFGSTIASRHYKQP